MPFSSVVTTPEEFVRIGAAFDEAWEVASKVDPLNATGQRKRLAAIIAELWSEQPAADLKLVALKRFDETALGLGSKTVTTPEIT